MVSCLLALIVLPVEQAQSQTTVEQVIPFELTSQNNIAVKVVLNERDQAVFMFHTAVSSVSMTQKATRRTTSVQFDQKAAVTSWGGQGQPVRYSSRNQLRIRGLAWDDIGITEDQLSGRFTDGKFGPNLFQGKVIEIDFDRRRLLIHAKLPATEGYERFKVAKRNGSMFLTGSVVVDGETIAHEYMVHSGYGSAILFDDQFAAEHQLTERLKVVGSRELRDSMGNVLKTSNVVVPRLRFGDTVLTDVAGEVFSGAIGRQKISVIGGAVLKRFDLLIDQGANELWMKRNGDTGAG